MTTNIRAALRGVAPLTARLETWMQDLLAQPDECTRLVAQFGSPVNVHNFAPMAGNVTELRDAAKRHGVDFQIYFARKANKTIAAVEAAVSLACGVDVASLNELRQCLEAGVSGERLIVSAAVKSRALLELAVGAGATVSVDNDEELHALMEVGAAAAVVPRAALRLAVEHPDVPPTRFGLTAAAWLREASIDPVAPSVEIAGVHFHLNGYLASARAIGIAQSLRLVADLRAKGHTPSFVDMGGGIPMSYLEDRREWDAFWDGLASLDAGDESLTWKSDRLGSIDGSPSSGVYPYFQELTRGDWLDQLLASPCGDSGKSIAEALTSAGLQLRCEPGRSLLDGCGLTLAEVAFTKDRSDGVALVGLHMNRTQCRSTSADFLLDPVLVRAGSPRRGRSTASAFLVGAYCIEEELLLRRRFQFPAGVGAGDLVAFPNTAGYLMHIVESASHQLPLATNVAWRDGQWVTATPSQTGLS